MALITANRTQDAGKRVLVIGAGVSGLTTALCLRQRGFKVTVVADRFGSRVTSVVAGALWEWPPAVCGRHDDEVSLARSKLWCRTSYDHFTNLAGDPATGVFLRPVHFYFTRPIGEIPAQQRKMEEVRDHVRQFRRDPALIVENRINAALGFRDAYSYLSPMIDTDAYIDWLSAQVEQSGCAIRGAMIDGPLRNQEAALLREYDVHAIVNCSGLGARELAQDALCPVRGALIRVRNDGKAMPKIAAAHCVSRDGSDADPGFVFILPRGNDTLLLGGFAELNQEDLNISMENHSLIREMHRRCVEFLPILQDAKFESSNPVRAGLRPFRSQGVRLECQAGTHIIHNYGHGGSGVTLSWGCAREVAELMEAMFRSE
jgi:D-amino-acid oxidase